MKNGMIAFYQFNEHSAVKIANNNEGDGYDFYINIDNKFLINELHRAKEDEKGLVKHWFVWGIVLAGLGMLGELHRYQKEKESNGEENGRREYDLDAVSYFCAGVARVVVPIIRSLYKGPVT